MIRDHNGQPLGQLALAAPGRFDGKATNGQQVTLRVTLSSTLDAASTPFETVPASTASKGWTMPEYQLYCFAQSGNAYRAALMLNLIGADWKPVFVDFFKGETRTPRVSRRDQRNGRGAGAGAWRQEAHASRA